MFFRPLQSPFPLLQRADKGLGETFLAFLFPLELPGDSSPDKALIEHLGGMIHLQFFPLRLPLPKSRKTPSILLQRKKKVFSVRKKEFRRCGRSRSMSIRREIRQGKVSFMPYTRNERHRRKPYRPNEFLVVKGRQLVLGASSPNEHGRLEVRKSTQYLQGVQNAGNRPRSLHESGQNIQPASGKTPPRHRQNVPHCRTPRSGNNPHVFGKRRKGALDSEIEKPLLAKLLLYHRTSPGLGPLAERKKAPGIKLVRSPGRIHSYASFHEDLVSHQRRVDLPPRLPLEENPRQHRMIIPQSKIGMSAAMAVNLPYLSPNHKVLERLGFFEKRNYLPRNLFY